jgi:thiol:disulfide interchange protein DsbD
MSRTQAFLLCLFLVLASACSKSATNTASAPNTSEPPAIRSTDVVEARPQEATLARGESGDAVVSIRIANGYHINANPPTYSYLKATELELQPAAGIAVQFITYPDPLTKKFPFAEKPLKVYEGETLVKVNLKADASVQPGKHNLSAKLRVQACDDKVCYAPGALDVTIPVNIK